MTSRDFTVYIDPTPLVCAECGERLTVFGSCGPWCLLCSEMFCTWHLIIRKGVPNCAACETSRRVREETGGVSDADEARVVGLILQDLACTVGPGHESAVEEAAARMRLFSYESAVEYFEQRVVDDVQQYLHDTFADTTWPACPHHPNHPLWYSEQWWRCEQAGARVVPLGGLAAKPNNDG